MSKPLSTALLMIILSLPMLLQPVAAQSDFELTESWSTWRFNPQNTGFHLGAAANSNQTIWTGSFGPAGVGSKRGGGSFPAAVGYGKIFIGCDDGVLYAIDESSGSLVWKQTIREGWDLFSPALVNNKVFVVSDAGVLAALDQKTGEIVWTKNVPAAPSINVADNRLFVAAFNGSLYCINATSSDIIWTRDLRDSSLTTYFITHPAVSNGQVFVGTASLSETDGSTLWNVTLSGQSSSGLKQSFPAVQNGKVFIAIKDTLYCLNQSNGLTIWSHYVGGDVTLNPLAVAYNRVYVSSSDGNIYCIDALTGENIWNQYLGGGTIMRFASTPVVADTKVYVNLNNLNWSVMCLNAINGLTIWSFVTAGPAAQPLISGGKIIVTLEHDPQIYALGPFPQPTETEIPEFPIWMIMLIIAAAMLIAAFLKKNPFVRANIFKSF